MKKRTQRTLCIFVATMLLLSLVSISVVAADTTIDAISDKNPGNSVSVIGTTVYNRVSIKIIKPNGTIYDVDSVQPLNGNYNYNFTLPEGITGVYTIVIGKGNSVVSTAFNVIPLLTEDEHEKDEGKDDGDADTDEDERHETPVEKTEGFVKRIYELLLNREAESEGLNFWIDKLLSREYTAAGVI